MFHAFSIVLRVLLVLPFQRECREKRELVDSNKRLQHSSRQGSVLVKRKEKGKAR